MRWFFIGALSVSALVASGEPVYAASAARTRAAKTKVKKRAKRPSAKRLAGRPPSAAPVAVAAAELEPLPLGEQAVYWALPRPAHPGVKVRLSPSPAATAIGEMHGGAIAVKVAGPTLQPAGLPPPLVRRGAGCRGWLGALPDGYLCQDEVQLRPGYLSDPPQQEKATTWQRFRYGVVKVASTVLLGATGQPSATEAGYLRAQLHKGDGITVVRELADRVQIYGKAWLRKMDVALATPPALTPINLQAVPAGQRFLVAWAVPPQGESQVALYNPTAGSSQPLWIPRYSQLWWTDTKASSPGRVMVYLTDETRTALGSRQDTRAVAQAAAFEIDASQLRRVTPAPLPAGLQPDERWIDISLSEQVAVAYAGDSPLFAAIVSTGKGATPAGSFFIYRKYLTQTMANTRGAPSQYDYREVPYAQFFNGRIGLHAVLWHDFLGHPVSHGCVNLSPAAAEQFFSFTKPDLPAGWHTVNGLGPAAPAVPFRGTRVVVRR